ncbi:MAG: hypothetical protein M1290_01455 [Candidatus Thermoplasmatota archaeon]|jgi:hypothetical protein|nr:hypothetical protein [Candidatus Thermoplasmatota archaeon]MCL5789115.1 hypothetical protein [Candidatus Thermoplasmatota archaeon]
MTGTRLRYPQLDGSARVLLSGKEFSIRFEGRAISILGNEENYSSLIPKLPFRLRNLSLLRKMSKQISDLEFTLKVEDEKGVMLSLGKGVITPLGHFSFRPRIRKYLK